MPGSGLIGQGLGFQNSVQLSGVRVRVDGLGFRVGGSQFRVDDLWLMVEG